MGVPGHNEIDFFFAKKYNIPIKYVLHSTNKKYDITENSSDSPLILENEAYLINSKDFDFLLIEEAKELIVKHLSLKNKAKFETSFKLRDWLVSRQRYWGAPIPIIYCEKCGELPVPEERLPVELPDAKLINFNEGIPLENCEEFNKTTCHKCGSNAIRDTNTLDTFFDSSFYFLRYIDKDNKTEIVDLNKFKNWLPVDIYIGGLEHAILHLLYSRFIYRFILDNFGILKKDQYDPNIFPAPFKEMITQGIIKSSTIIHKTTGKYITKEELINYKDEEIKITFEKMSKSKMNGINPIEEVKKHGIDVVRLMILFSGPIQLDINYDEDLYKPIYGFLRKFSKYFEFVKINYKDYIHENLSNEIIIQEIKSESKEIIQLLLEVNGKIIDRSFHVAIARLMECLNLLNEKKEIFNEKAANLLYYFSINYLILLYPIAPHISSHEFNLIQTLSQNKHFDQYIFNNDLDLNLDQLKYFYNLLNEEIKIQIQINGKFKGMITIDHKKKNNKEHIITEAHIQIQGFSVNKIDIIKLIIPEKSNVLNIVTTQKKNKI